jgi:hypothetical protein
MHNLYDEVFALLLAKTLSAATNPPTPVTGFSQKPT